MARAIYNIMLALWVGGIFIYTFLVTPIIFNSFGRDAASAIVDKLFPFYFPYVLVVALLSLVFILVSGPGKAARRKLTLTLLAIAVLVSLIVTFGIYPEMKKAKQEVASFEKATADSPAKKRFGALHGVSMALNLFLLVDGVALIVIGSVGRNGSGRS